MGELKRAIEGAEQSTNPASPASEFVVSEALGALGAVGDLEPSLLGIIDLMTQEAGWGPGGATRVLFGALLPPWALDRVISLLGHHAGRVQCKAAMVLQHAPPSAKRLKEAAALLANILDEHQREPDSPVVGEAVRTLAAFGTPACSRLLLDRMASIATWVDPTMAWTIGRASLGGSEHIDQLLAHLNGPAPLRRAVAACLCAMDECSGRREDVAGRLEGRLEDPDLGVRTQAARALLTWGDESMKESATDCLMASVAEGSVEAALVLGEATFREERREELVTSLVRLLPDTRAGSCAALALAGVLGGAAGRSFPVDRLVNLLFGPTRAEAHAVAVAMGRLMADGQRIFARRKLLGLRWTMRHVQDLSR